MPTSSKPRSSLTLNPDEMSVVLPYLDSNSCYAMLFISKQFYTGFKRQLQCGIYRAIADILFPQKPPIKDILLGTKRDPNCEVRYYQPDLNQLFIAYLENNVADYNELVTIFRQLLSSCKQQLKPAFLLTNNYKELIVGMLMAFAALDEQYHEMSQHLLNFITHPDYLAANIDTADKYGLTALAKVITTPKLQVAEKIAASKVLLDRGAKSICLTADSASALQKIYQLGFTLAQNNSKIYLEDQIDQYKGSLKPR